MRGISHTILHCRLVEIIGGGGMGIICKVEDTKLHRHVALKFLPEEVSSNPQTLERFLPEAQTASALNHPVYVRTRINGCARLSQQEKHILGHYLSGIFPVVVQY